MNASYEEHPNGSENLAKQGEEHLVHSAKMNAPHEELPASSEKMEAQDEEHPVCFAAMEAADEERRLHGAKTILDDFADRTTLHGIPRAIRGRSTSVRCFWVFIVIGAASMLGYQLSELLRRYCTVLQTPPLHGSKLT